jgi:hypothetical protein
MSGYNQQYLAIKQFYDRLPLMDDADLDNRIATLDKALQKYQTTAAATAGPAYCSDTNGNKIGSPSGDGRLQVYTEVECASLPNSYWNANGECTKTTGGSYSWECRPGIGNAGPSSTALNDAFAPISQYYSDLLNIKHQLQNFIDSSSSKVIDLDSRLESEERYDNRVHPEESIKSRELMLGLFPELRPSSVPVLMAAGVFMSSIAILMIFQMMGFTGQINLPPALLAAPGQLSSAVGSEPLYKNPLVLGGVSVVLAAGLIVFAVLYFKAKY